MAGFFGCSRGTNSNSHIDTSSSDYDPALHDFSVGLEGLEGRDSPNGTAGDPDEITLRGATGIRLSVQGHRGGGIDDPMIVLGSKTTIEKSICGYSNCIGNSVADIVLVSDCASADLFQVTSLTAATGETDVGFNDNPPTGTPGNSSGTELSNLYDENSSIYPLRVATYYIGGPCDVIPERAETADSAGKRTGSGRSWRRASRTCRSSMERTQMATVPPIVMFLPLI